jgi:hypothetical protein
MTALMTPTVAVLAAFVALRQWSTARNKLKLDLFDRRFAVYQAARTLIGHIGTSGGVSEEAIIGFVTATREAKWLLNDDLDKYLNKTMYNMANLHQATISELNVSAAGEERVRLSARKATQRKLLLDQMEVLDDKFRPFLQLGH